MANGKSGDYTEPLKLSKKEAIKSARDAGLVALSWLIIQVIDILKITDFGDYTPFIALVIAMIMPILNRYFNIVRM